MAKVTSKLQVTIPKALADQYGIRPGAEVTWAAAGDAIRVVPGKKRPPVDPSTRLAFFLETTARVDRLQASRRPLEQTTDRGWKREDLYVRGRSG